MELDKNGLAFMRVNRYSHKLNLYCDFRALPRPFYTVATILHGAADFVEDARTSHVEDGECIFIPIHSRYHSYWTACPSTELLSCHFLLPASCSPIHSKRFFVQKLSNSESISPLLRELYVIQNDEHLFFSVLSKFYAICSETFAHLDCEPAPPLSPRIQEAASFIESHYREAFSIGDLASHCGMSESHLYSCFRRELGLSPIAYKHRVAITAAEQLLTAHEELTIEQVSERTGFETSAYFRRVFKSMTGCSPRAYRQQQNGL